MIRRHILDGSRRAGRVDSFISIKPVLLIFISLAMILESSSDAFIFEYSDKEGHAIYRIYPNREKRWQPDTTCLFSPENKALNLPTAEAIKTITKMRFDRQLNLYLCASNATVCDVSEPLFNLLSIEFTKHRDRFVKRLEKSQTDSDKMFMLMFFMIHGFEEILNKSKGKDDFSDSDLPFPPELARLLVQKATELTDPEIRDFYLDRLICQLPHDEAVAREAQREPSTWERVK